MTNPYKKYKSKYNINYTLQIPRGSGKTIGEIEFKFATLTIKRGYYGGGFSPESWDNPEKQNIIISIDFIDGCSTSINIGCYNKDWREQTEQTIQYLKDNTKDFMYYINERKKLFAEIKPLQKRASICADNMFSVVDAIEKIIKED